MPDATPPDQPAAGPPEAGGTGAERPAPGAAAAPRSHRAWWVAIGAVAIAVAAAGVLWWWLTRNIESTDDAFIDARIVHISPQANGRIVSVAVTDNQLVHAGDELLGIASADYHLRLLQARAQQAQRWSDVAQAEAQCLVGRAQVEDGRAAATSAAALARAAAADLERYRDLEQRNPQALSRQQLDQAVAQAIDTAARVASALRKAEAARAQLRMFHAQLAMARAQYDHARAQVGLEQIAIGYTRIVAPVSGHVTRLQAAIGEQAQIGQDILVIVPLELWVTANFKETQLIRMRPGQAVDLRIDAYPGVSFTGRVDSIQRGSGPAFSLLPPENATGNYVKVVQRVPVKITFDQPVDEGHPVGPGMSVQPRVHIR